MLRGAGVVCSSGAGKGFGDAAKQPRKPGKQKQAGVQSGDSKVRGASRALP